MLKVAPCTVGRSVLSPICFGADVLLLFHIIMGRAPLLYKTLLIIGARSKIFKAKRGAAEWFQ